MSGEGIWEMGNERQIKPQVSTHSVACEQQKDGDYSRAIQTSGLRSAFLKEQIENPGNKVWEARITCTKACLECRGTRSGAIITVPGDYNTTERANHDHEKGIVNVLLRESKRDRLIHEANKTNLNAVVVQL